MIRVALVRSPIDVAALHVEVADAGVTLVSATENIDETPSGMLLHGIMSTIAEFYSRNLATEVTKGIASLTLENEVPISLGVLITDTIEQAIEKGERLVREAQG